MLIGIELVKDRDAKTPADPGIAPHIKDIAMQEGLIIYPGGGTADGLQGAHILLAPPFIYESGHVDELVTKLGKVMTRVRAFM
jgi:adenosylmethionine-8-amino-7-oxononanoate aminotransferase